MEVILLPFFPSFLELFIYILYLGLVQMDPLWTRGVLSVYVRVRFLAQLDPSLRWGLYMLL